jgi:hypothetical protein
LLCSKDHNRWPMPPLSKRPYDVTFIGKLEYEAKAEVSGVTAHRCVFLCERLTLPVIAAVCCCNRLAVPALCGNTVTLPAAGAMHCLCTQFAPCCECQPAVRIRAGVT